MCGRYTLGKDADKLKLDFPGLNILKQLMARFNVAPGQPIAAWISGAESRMDLFSWGLVPSWAKDPAIGNKMINARAETLTEKPSFRKAVERRRCLVPMDGYYEWKRVKGSSRKQPMYLCRKDRSAFGVAGLWDTWHDKDGGYIVSATLITTRPNRLARQIHHRMPAIVREEDVGRWLSSETFSQDELREILSPVAADDFEVYPVSTRVNRVSEEGPELIHPVEEPPPPAEQGMLF